MPGIDYTLGMKTAGFTGALQGALGKIGGIGAAITGALGAVGGLGLAFQAVGKAADLETLRTAFIPLLGGVEEAKERLAELSAFAASTPFEIPQVVKASKTLETLTRGALSTGRGLTLVGDVASGTGQSFDEIAVTIGRLYDGLDSGRPVGEALARLQELGVVSGDTRGKIEALQKEGRKGAEVWAVAEGALGRFSGSMELQSGTWNGKLSNLQDNIGQALAAFGEPIIDAVKPFLDSAIGATGSLTTKAAEFGAKIGEAIGFISAAFSSGELAGMAGDALKIGFMESVNFLYAAMRGTLRAIGQGFVETFRNAVMYFEILTTPDFWRGMGSALTGVFLDTIGFLQRGLANAMEAAKPLAELFGKGDAITSAQKTLTDSADILSAAAKEKYDKAGSQLEGTLDKIGQRIEDAANNMTGAFEKGFSEAGDVLDSSGARASLAESAARIQRLQEETAKKTAASQAAIAEGILKPTAVATATATGKAASSAGSRPAADRLAQIGGFVGNAANGLAQRAAEKTASYMEKAVVKLTSIDRRISNPSPSGVFV
jgi:hypothetical protein